MIKKPELLAPAGDFEKLQLAVTYGADAVYVGGKQFSLRANATNFDNDELRKAVAYAHEHDVKVYVGANIFAHNADIHEVESYLHSLRDMDVDAVIVADPGIFDIARNIDGLEVHISTQANVTNYQSALFYRNLGASRVILARELSLPEITEINEKIAQSPSERPFDTEVFVHGAMCVAYSGRCLLSNFLTGRDGNKGDCAQPCRSNFHLHEERRPGEYIPIIEEDRGTYLLNSKDLCMIEHIPELIASGVSSFKIEGRMKSPHFVAAITHTYRQAIDDYFECEKLYESKKAHYMSEIKKTNYREFFTGFFFGRPTEGQRYTDNVYSATNDFMGIVLDYDAEKELALVEQRNKFSVGDSIDFLMAGFTQVVVEMYDEDGSPIESAPHPQQRVRLKVDKAVKKLEILRKGTEATPEADGVK